MKLKYAKGVSKEVIQRRANVEPCPFCTERYGSKNGKQQMFKGYYVDIHWRRFESKFEYPKGIEIINFTDEKGMELLYEMHETLMEEE